MAEIPEASEVGNTIDDTVKREADDLESEVANKVSDLKYGSERQTSIDASNYSEAAKRVVDERLTTKNYDSRVDRDEIKVHVPETYSSDK
jgi:hypothetical protein